MSDQEIFNLLHDMKMLNKNFSIYEAENREYVEMRLGRLITREGVAVPGFHYIYIECNNTIHATSNIPWKLEESQRIGHFINGLVLPSAKRPGTVLTENIKDFWINDRKFKMVNAYEISSIKFNNRDLFTIPKTHLTYIEEKRSAFKKLFDQHLSLKGYR